AGARADDGAKRCGLYHPYRLHPEDRPAGLRPPNAHANEQSGFDRPGHAGRPENPASRVVRIGILEPDGFSPMARTRLQELGAVSDFAGGEVAGFTADKDVLFVRLSYRIDGAFVADAPSLRVLCSPTTGLTHIDTDALRQKQVRLLSLKGETAF